MFQGSPLGSPWEVGGHADVERPVRSVRHDIDERPAPCAPVPAISHGTTKRAWVAGTSPAMTMEGLPGWERASPTSARLEWDLVVEVFGEGTAGRGGDA